MSGELLSDQVARGANKKAQNEREKLVGYEIEETFVNVDVKFEQKNDVEIYNIKDNNVKIFGEENNGYCIVKEEKKFLKCKVENNKCTKDCVELTINDFLKGSVIKPI
jgi:hypothetical protein